MQLRKNSPLVRLVEGSGIETFAHSMWRGRINLCPFFWMVVISILLLPFRPLLNSGNSRLRTLPWWAMIAAWVGLHAYRYDIVWRAVLRWGRKFTEAEQLPPLSVLERLFYGAVVVEIWIALTLLAGVILVAVVVGVLWCICNTLDLFASWREEKESAALSRMSDEERQAYAEQKYSGELPPPSRLAKVLTAIFSPVGKVLYVIFRPIGGPLKTITRSVKEFCELAGAFILAKKQRVCPPVELMD